MENNDKKWNKFTATGSIYDYLEYKNVVYTKLPDKYEVKSGEKIGYK